MQMLVSLTETSSPAEWSMLRFSFCCLRPCSRTSFHHQPEAQHLKSSAIHKLPADYPIFRGYSGREMLAVRLSHFDSSLPFDLPFDDQFCCGAQRGIPAAM